MHQVRICPLLRVVASVAPVVLGFVSAACQAVPDESASVEEQRTPAVALLDRSIEFHDPLGVWGRREVLLAWGSEGGRLEVELGFRGAGEFTMRGRYRESEIDYWTDGSSWTARVDGEAELTEDARERMVLGREDGFFWRNYFGFLAGLPMGLRDPGVHLAPEAIDTTFEGDPVRAVRVTFDPGVGEDIWYFYFEPETARLVGCRFHHEESANDGEYIVFEGLLEVEGMSLPRRRLWYVNEDRSHLGTDVLGAVPD